jgi:nitrite reductase/ring-hydroxylating ferredoxin subunit
MAAASVARARATGMIETTVGHPALPLVDPGGIIRAVAAVCPHYLSMAGWGGTASTVRVTGAASTSPQACGAAAP